MRFGLSSFQEQAAHQRMLETELARSIEIIAGIESARVHLALPKQSAFLREAVSPSASVLLKLKSGAVLTPEQVQAVRLIVARSVPGMTTELVNVVDAQGTLSASKPVDAGEKTSPRIEIPPTPSMPSSGREADDQTGRKLPSAQPALNPVTQLPAAQTWLAWLAAQNREILLGLLLAVFVAWLFLRLRAHGHPAPEIGDDKHDSQSLEVQLVQLRQRVIADPGVAASVVKLWIQKP
jgi:hypothetical protein